jgi:hypothetical protein
LNQAQAGSNFLSRPFRHNTDTLSFSF